MAGPVDLLDRKLIFVTGKGGVGKTTVAASLALLAAGRGNKTLVCEVDAKGNLADFYETGPIHFEEREIAPKLWAMSMDTEASLRQYISLQLKLPLVARVGPLARMFDFVASAAPGVKEIVTVGKLCWEVRERHYDTIVVDASASGHVVSQLAAPQAINQLVQVGLVRQQTGWMLDILGDPHCTGLVVVATPAGRGGGLRPHRPARGRVGPRQSHRVSGSSAARRGPVDRRQPAQPDRAPRAAAGRDRPGRASPVRPVSVFPQSRFAGHPPGR
jgi:hypothetical protein